MTEIAGAPVVVGVDGSESALDAVRLAAIEADLHRLPLRVVHAFVWVLLPVPLGPDPAGPPKEGSATTPNGWWPRRSTRRRRRRRALR